MNRRRNRIIASVLIVTLTNTPILGSISLPLAAAQATQNTTYSYLYDNLGNVTQVTDPLGNVTNLSYDALARIKQQIQPVPASGVARPASNFTYDGLNQASTVVDPRNLTTTYTSDGLGNQSALASPDTGSSSRSFDAAGNVLTSTDARGKVTAYTYDALNRVTSISYASGTPTQFEYDGGSTGAPYAIGHLTKMTDESGQTSYAYNQAGQVVGKVQTSLSGTRQVAYGYAGSGKLTSVTYPSGNRINYAYDAAGNVSQIVLNPSDGSGGTNTGVATVVLDQISYAPFGAVKSWQWGTSSESAPNLYARSFDLDGRMVSYPLGNPALSGTAVIRAVTYDAASRITGYTHTGNANAATLDQTFGYDGLGRLTSFVNATGSQSYAYDASGNRIRLSIGGASYVNSISATSNRLTATAGPLPAKSNIIDNAGNLTSDGSASFTYSDRGRLKSATKAGYTTNYLYNGLGQRVSKSGAEAAEYVYDEAGRLIGEYGGAGTMLAETVWLGGMPVAVLKPSAQAGAPQVYYVYTDHLATPRVIADSATGAVVWSWIDADPFGMTPPNEAASGGSNFTFNMRFPGQYFDRETGLHYNYFRDYDPSTGRYIESDPVGLRAGVNTYGYVSGNPVSLSDPNGLCPFCLVIPAVCAGGACEAGLALIGGAGWFAATRPQGMSRLEERHFDRQCQNTDDPCRNLKAAVATAISDARVKMDAMRNDTVLYKYAYSTPNPSVTNTSTTWIGHADDLNGRINNVWAMITLGRKMGCDMSNETSAAMTLLTPGAPNP